MDWAPSAKDALFSTAEVGVVGFQREACNNIEVQAGFVAEVDADGLPLGSGSEFYVFDDLALGLRKLNTFRGSDEGAVASTGSNFPGFGFFLWADCRRPRRAVGWLPFVICCFIAGHVFLSFQKDVVRAALVF